MARHLALNNKMWFLPSSVHVCGGDYPLGWYFIDFLYKDQVFCSNLFYFVKYKIRHWLFQRCQISTKVSVNTLKFSTCHRMPVNHFQTAVVHGCHLVHLCSGTLPDKVGSVDQQRWCLPQFPRNAETLAHPRSAELESAFERNSQVICVHIEDGSTAPGCGSQPWLHIRFTQEL